MKLRAIHPGCGRSDGFTKIEDKWTDVYVWCNHCREFTPIDELRLEIEGESEDDGSSKSA
jgi:hypothetical protein